MLIESPNRKPRPARDLVDRSTLITLLPEQDKPSSFQSGSLLQTPFLLRRCRKILTSQQVRTPTQARLPGRIITPTRAPAQHQSIQPPKTPATSGAIFGNATGKNALENGSSSNVGSATEIAPAGHCSGGSLKRLHRRRTSQAISGKLAAKRIIAPFQSPRCSRCCPANRKAAVAVIQIPRPQRKRRIFII